MELAQLARDRDVAPDVAEPDRRRDEQRARGRVSARRQRDGGARPLVGALGEVAERGG